MSEKLVDILLVEDSPSDIALIKRCFSKGKIKANLSIVRDGEEALDFLFLRGASSDHLRPDLILLDINLPKKNGIDVLKEIKQDPIVKKIPVIVLSTSNMSKDIIASYENYANAFISKPVKEEEFFKIVSEIEDFWLNLVTLPQRNVN